MHASYLPPLYRDTRTFTHLLRFFDNIIRHSIRRHYLHSRITAMKGAHNKPHQPATITNTRGSMLTKRPLKAPLKAPIKAPSNPRKRKNDEDQRTTTPPVKKVRVVKRSTPKPKAKVAINQRPSQRLDVYVFGEGSSSELGLGTAKTAIDVKRPRLNPLLSAKQIGVVQIACGGMHVAALTHDNKILTWGVNDQGALGRDTTWEGGLKDMNDNVSEDSDRSDSGLNPAESNPTSVPASSFPQDTQFVKLAAGDSHTLALTDDGHVYGWGTFRVNISNQLNQSVPQG